MYPSKIISEDLDCSKFNNSRPSFAVLFKLADLISFLVDFRLLRLHECRMSNQTARDFTMRLETDRPTLSLARSSVAAKVLQTD